MAFFSRLPRAVALVCAVAVVLLVCACSSDADQARDAVTSVMEGYVVPVSDEEGKEPDTAAWDAADFGDASTMETLKTYGVVPDEWHRHCFAHYSFEVGDATVGEDGSVSVPVTITNQSLSAAADAAGAGLSALVESGEAEQVYAQGGKAALFARLVDLLYEALDANATPVTTTVDLVCTKGDDGAWKPGVAGNEAFFSALYGGSNVVGGLANALAAADGAQVEGQGQAA